MIQKRHEKILKELEKRYDMERAKNTKLKDSLQTKEDEASALQKVSITYVMSVHVFLSRQMSYLHDILAPGLRWAYL